MSAGMPRASVRTARFLTVAGLVFAATGAVFLVAPGLVPAVREHAGASADARNDARALYGAMEAGLGAFLLHAARRPGFHAAALACVVWVGVCMAASRFVGLALDAATPGAHAGYGALDLGFALAAAALARAHARADTDTVSSPR